MSDASGWLWFTMEVIGPVVLAIALIYGILRWRSRPKSPGMQQVRDQKTKEGYRRGGGA